MITQTPPFRGSSEMDLLRNIHTKELKIPDDVPVSRGVVELIAKLLDRDPNRRWSVEQTRAHVSKLLPQLHSNVDSSLPMVPTPIQTTYPPSTPVVGPSPTAAKPRTPSSGPGEPLPLSRGIIGTSKPSNH